MSLWSDPSAGRFGAQRRGSGRAEAVERIKDWTRERFALREEDMVLVTEIAATAPGFPPLETHVGFWDVEGTRYRFRVFRAVEEVLQSDVPPAWMKATLAGDPGYECSCC